MEVYLPQAPLTPSPRDANWEWAGRCGAGCATWWGRRRRLEQKIWRRVSRKMHECGDMGPADEQPRRRIGRSGSRRAIAIGASLVYASGKEGDRHINTMV